MCTNRLMTSLTLGAALLCAGAVHALESGVEGSLMLARANPPAQAGKGTKPSTLKLKPATRLQNPPAADAPPQASEEPALRAARSADLQWHGFISQGFDFSKGNNVNGSSADSNGSFRYQEIGLNASWRPRGDLLVSGQLASVRAGDATDEYLVLEYGLADYTPVQTELGRFGVRAGKLKLPIGFYNDSRDAVFTRPSILLPAMYLDNAGGRSFGYFSQVGAGVYGDAYAGDHALYIEALGFGEQKLGENADIAILRSKASGRFKIKRGALIRLADDYDGGRARAALSLATVTINYEADHSQPFSPANLFAQDGAFHFSQAQLSLQYNWPDFSLTSEYVWRKFQIDELIPANPFGASFAVDLRPTAAYLQGTWRISPKWSSFLRYDEEIRESQDRGGHALARKFHVPHYYFYSKDWTVGTRYNLRSNLAVWGEFHYVDGVIFVNPLDNPDFGKGTAPRYWNLLTLMIGYRF
jgi:hypothetical protein